MLRHLLFFNPDVSVMIMLFNPTLCYFLIKLQK